MDIVTTSDIDHQALRTPASEVVFPLSDDVKAFIDEMRQFIENLQSPYGKPAGLAAPQVGSNLKIAFFQVPEIAKEIRGDVHETLPLTIMINPSYQPIAEKGISMGWEGCFSVEDKMAEVPRYKAIRYRYFNEQGKEITGIAEGFTARVMQHEIGHLNGELFVDLLTEHSRVGNFEEMMKIRKQELQQDK